MESALPETKEGEEEKSPEMAEEKKKKNEPREPRAPKRFSNSEYWTIVWFSIYESTLLEKQRELASMLCQEYRFTEGAAKREAARWSEGAITDNGVTKTCYIRDDGSEVDSWLNVLQRYRPCPTREQAVEWANEIADRIEKGDQQKSKKESDKDNAEDGAEETKKRREKSVEASKGDAEPSKAETLVSKEPQKYIAVKKVEGLEPSKVENFALKKHKKYVTWAELRFLLSKKSATPFQSIHHVATPFDFYCCIEGPRLILDEFMNAIYDKALALKEDGAKADRDMLLRLCFENGTRESTTDEEGADAAADGSSNSSSLSALSKSNGLPTSSMETAGLVPEGCEKVMDGWIRRTSKNTPMLAKLNSIPPIFPGSCEVDNPARYSLATKRVSIKKVTNYGSSGRLVEKVGFHLACGETLPHLWNRDGSIKAHSGKVIAAKDAAEAAANLVAAEAAVQEAAAANNKAALADAQAAVTKAKDWAATTAKAAESATMIEKVAREMEEAGKAWWRGKVLLTKLQPGSASQRSGLRPRDIILRVLDASGE